MTDTSFDFFCQEIESVSKKADKMLMKAGLSERQAKVAAEVLWKMISAKIQQTYRQMTLAYYSSVVRRRRTSIIADQRRSIRPQTEPNMEVEIKRIVTKVLKSGKEKTSWGIEFRINGNTFTVNFGSKDRTMLYICTLLRLKIGENMYLHEFFNNSKGRHSKFKRANSRAWIKAVFDTIFPTKERDFEEWIGKIESANGRPLNQGKTQASKHIEKALDSQPDAIYYCILRTKEDKAGDSFYHMNISPKNIIIPQELSFLVDHFYDMIGLGAQEF